MNNHASAATVLLSGGIDSTVLLHHVVKELGCTPVHALSFDYGQRHAKELACAHWQAEAVGIAEHRVIELTFLRDLLSGASTLMADGPPVPDLSELRDGDTDQPPTYVPNRNMMLLSIAAAYAEARGVRDVYYGAQAQDEYGYWDCTTDFLDRINAVLHLNRRDAITIHAPLIAASKAENVRKGIELGVDFAHTWSCYRGGDAPCGTCPTCVERANAFDAVSETDPLSKT
jgi:7-cyano-7-deazaguanine synthase